MKEDLSLDDLAGIFSPSLTSKSLSKDELIKRNIVNRSTIDFLVRLYGSIEIFPFEKILYARIWTKRCNREILAWKKANSCWRPWKSTTKNMRVKTASWFF